MHLLFRRRISLKWPAFNVTNLIEAYGSHTYTQWTPEFNRDTHTHMQMKLIFSTRIVSEFLAAFCVCVCQCNTIIYIQANNLVHTNSGLRLCMYAIDAFLQFLTFAFVSKGIKYLNFLFVIDDFRHMTSDCAQLDSLWWHHDEYLMSIFKLKCTKAIKGNIEFVDIISCGEIVIDRRDIREIAPCEPNWIENFIGRWVANESNDFNCKSLTEKTVRSKSKIIDFCGAQIFNIRSSSPNLPDLTYLMHKNWLKRKNRHQFAMCFKCETKESSMRK